MKVWPLKFRENRERKYTFSDNTGVFFSADETFLERYVHDSLNSRDLAFLDRMGLIFDPQKRSTLTAPAIRLAQRTFRSEEVGYVILVPTLRCNLNCEYCQVSRVSENAKGFDWSEETLEQILKFLGSLKSPKMKVEFQGGEPLLRLDLLDQVRQFCRKRFDEVSFVVCTNLQNVSEKAWDFLSAKDTYISTSLDGTFDEHKKNRTFEETTNQEFQSNINRAIKSWGTDKVSALPTLDPTAPPDPKEIISTYTSLGMRSIYLRRVNFQGFARKKFSLHEETRQWSDFYRSFIEALIEHNAHTDDFVEEYYLSHLLRRIFQRGQDGHVDLRNPNWLGIDYLVVDFDGVIYPTDEARMVSRIGKVNLAIGDIRNGINHSALQQLNSVVSNNFDPDCCECPYQAFCGLDPVDDLSRYGRVDLPRHTTMHCRTHLELFDYVFEMIYSNDWKIKKSIAHWMDVPEFPVQLAPKIR
jgi:His-Xaa-Ser system radical SAM maturase HxsB